MRWFSKAKSSDPRPAAPTVTPVSAFWSWWAGGAKEKFAAAIADGSWGDLPDVMSERVHAIHPDLQWELSAGTRSRHTLCVTSAGTAELRPLAQRWRRAAPAEDATWQYEPSRSRDTSVAQGQLELGEQTLSLSETTITAELDDDRLRFDVVVGHPQLVRLDESQRHQFAFLVLDWALGEDDVERWVGGVDVAAQQRPGASGIDEFIARVDALAQQPSEETWVLLRGIHQDGLPLLALARRPLRWIDSPLLDQHDEVTLDYAPGPDGLPTGDALTRLRRLEDELTAAVGPAAQLLAHETYAGRRLLHLYSDSEDQNVTAVVERWVRQTEGASVEVAADPAWRSVRHLA